MQDNLFDTPEKKSSAVLKFQSLQDNLGWQLVVQIVTANLQVLHQQLKDGVEGQTIEDINRLRDKIKDHENFINTPEDMIKELTDEDPRIPEEDPYEQRPERPARIK